MEHVDIVAPDPHDMLHELLDDLGEVHDVDFLIGNFLWFLPLSLLSAVDVIIG